MKRIKETTFTIAKEIMLKKVEEATLPKTTVKKIAVKYDYNKALEIMKIVEAMKRVEQRMNYDWVSSTLFNAFIGPIKMYKDDQKTMFIDRKIDDYLDDMLATFCEFSSHSLDYTAIPGTSKHLDVPVLGEVIVSMCKAYGDVRKSTEQYIDIIKRFMEKYENFMKYVGGIKLYNDCML